jgi:DNA processing protein
MALEQDRQVFAVPGSPLTGKARGSNRLIKEGARLVDCVEDVLEDLAPQLLNLAGDGKLEPEIKGKAAPLQSSSENGSESNEIKTLLSCLKDADKLHVDSIIESTGLNTQTVLNLLLELELKGIVVQHPGKLFALAELSAARSA